jgi:hypothetical protein
MSSDDDTTVICGSTNPFSDKQIWVYDSAVSIAIKIDRRQLYNLSVAAGMSPAKAERRVHRFIQLVEHSWYNIGDYLEDKLCVEYTRHEPHPQNFEP